MHLQESPAWGRVVFMSALLAVGAAVPGLFISFLFAYGFNDSVNISSHLIFVTLVAIGAGCVAALATLLTDGNTAAGFEARMKPAALTAGALYSAILGAGVIVSGMNKEQNSVTVDWSTTTDIIVATVFFVVALGAVFALWASHPRR